MIQQATRTDMEERLRDIARASAWFAPALRAVRDLGLPSWCIGAGAVRNLVWDALHGYSTPSDLADLDVAYFDAADLAPERDAELESRLREAMPGIRWEVTNQAAVHRWFEGYFGHAVEPLESLEDAVASWPEYATAVGLCLRQDGLAPCALHPTILTSSAKWVWRNRSCTTTEKSCAHSPNEMELGCAISRIRRPRQATSRARRPIGCPRFERGGVGAQSGAKLGRICKS